ncbi:MAG: hypothetical protein HY858_02520 [Candidatus Solibacter usitatus]|nr:hypothetical protein [Candidatus Solibacter usitatus]
MAVAALLVLVSAGFAASPLEFGLAEYRKALDERGLSAERFPILTEYSMVLSHDGFSITGNIVRGGSQRGLMYGLLEAAAQIRRQGRLAAAKSSPATPIRGIRWFLHNAGLEERWYHDRDHWRAFFEMLARNRFNRFNLVFAHQTGYMAPPYPFWVSVPEFPNVRATSLTSDQRERNLDSLRFISETAVEFGIDFTLGIWEHNVQRGMTPTVEGLTADNIGPYSYAALKMVLAACPSIRSVQMRTNAESGIPSEKQVEFYRDWVFRALSDSGRLVQLDLRGWLMQKGLMEAALAARVPLRLSSKYWAEDLGRPYQPAETWPNYSFLNFLEKPAVSDRERPYQFYWELWGLGSHRLLMWGDPDYVRRAVPTFTLSGSAGFEIDPPLAQKGFGNRPGVWGVFEEKQTDRVFWKYEWQRYWLFYLLWGRLSYDPAEPESLWMDEFTRRFGTPARDVFDAVRNASKVLNEVVAVHLADPNMYIWPEINPGGLIDSYAEVRPSDWRFVASPLEAARARIAGEPSARQTPLQTSARLHEFALQTEQASARAQALLGDKHSEWLGTRPDIDTLALLGRFHGRRQMAADHLAWFYLTGDDSALYGARRETAGALRLWQDLVKLTDGLYPAQMAFGPDDTGHWKDKLTYLEHDLKTVNERVALFEKYGRIDRGFDFGAAVRAARPGSYRQTSYVEGNTVLPGFAGVSPDTEYSEALGYGWLAPAARTAQGLEPTPYSEVRAVAKNPQRLPANTLIGDSIAGRGAQVFRVKTAAGDYRILLLTPDGSAEERTGTAAGGVLDIVMPEGEWRYSGVLLQAARPPSAPARWPMPLSCPALEHTPPKRVETGRPLQLSLAVYPPTHVRTVRLHYRPLNQLVQWKTMDAPAQRALFIIPGEELDVRWDLQYYFEALNTERTGWFHPDPAQATPYYVVPVVFPLPEPAPASVK